MEGSVSPIGCCYEINQGGQNGNKHEKETVGQTCWKNQLMSEIRLDYME